MHFLHTQNNNKLSNCKALVDEKYLIGRRNDRKESND